MVDVADLLREIDCVYDGELHSVRDNGAVRRHPRAGRPPRPSDEVWTFGKPNDKTGYMQIASVRVHRIVATAFHDVPPTPEHVVDHIDTNRRNNRPENLRWLTRLENALLNPVTVRRIVLVCGSIQAFLEDPSRLGASSADVNFGWMRTVTKDEAQASLARLQAWAASGKPTVGGALGEWVFQPPSTRPADPAPEAEPNGLVMAITLGAAQRGWRVPSEFPGCPADAGDAPLVRYAEGLQEGAVFSTNRFSTSDAAAWALSNGDRELWVICQLRDNPIKRWALAEVTYEGGLFVHTSRGTFFEREGADKQFTLGRGLEWTGGDSIDDYT